MIKLCVPHDIMSAGVPDTRCRLWCHTPARRSSNQHRLTGITNVKSRTVVHTFYIAQVWSAATHHTETRRVFCVIYGVFMRYEHMPLARMETHKQQRVDGTIWYSNLSQSIHMDTHFHFPTSVYRRLYTRKPLPCYSVKMEEETEGPAWR